MNETEGTPTNVSLRRLEANRRNAGKSTGPRTAAGKAAARMNAVKCGLFTRQVVVRGLQVRERKEDFQALRERLWEELAPVGVMEADVGGSDRDDEVADAAGIAGGVG
jgi:hypothetical protein